MGSMSAPGSFRDRVKPAASPGMVRYAAKSGSELSSRDATGMTLMTEAVTIDRSPVAKPVSRRRSATVSASALRCTSIAAGPTSASSKPRACCTDGSGFPLDQSRVAYLRYLRRERQQSPRAAADAKHAEAKTELLQIRIDHLFLRSAKPVATRVEGEYQWPAETVLS
jgi:hypothetical protein